MNEAQWWLVRKSMAYSGSSARSTKGSCAMFQMPEAPSARNHSRHTGPNSRPTWAVPRLCSANRPSSTPTVSGSTQRSNTSVPTCRPSIADSTEIAGVSTVSPKNSAAPSRPSSVTKVRRRGRSFTAELASAMSAMVPPSPLLSARITSTTYLSDTTSISAQKMVDRPPRMLVVFRSMPRPGEKVSFTAYSGLVPMSPNTTPSAASVRAAREDCLAWLSCSKGRAEPYSRTAQNANRLLAAQALLQLEPERLAGGLLDCLHAGLPRRRLVPQVGDQRRRRRERADPCPAARAPAHALQLLLVREPRLLRLGGEPRRVRRLGRLGLQRLFRRDARLQRR